MTGDPPALLPPLDPTVRVYPPSWRDAAIRALYRPDLGGVPCPRCAQVFRRPADLRRLQADHILAYARGGATTWENLQLLCAACNAAKGAG
jgi:5-methylcytosine-specific restriction endonuclease McrA